MATMTNPNVNTLYPIGLNLPIQKGNSGYFDQTYDSVSAAKANIINLLNTNKGERRFQPLFGSGLRKALFEQNLNNNTDILQQIVINDINNWIPNVTVIKVNLSLSSQQINSYTDTYTVEISLNFMVNNIMDTVDLTIQQQSI
jgi:phage baseplate assembly protein W